MDHIFTLRQVPEEKHKFTRPTFLLFLDFKTTFNSVDCNALWHCLFQETVFAEFVTPLKSLYSVSWMCSCLRQSIIWVHREKWCSQPGPIFLFIYNFVKGTPGNFLLTLFSFWCAAFSKWDVLWIKICRWCCNTERKSWQPARFIMQFK